jgi:hypothetical protein
MRSAWTENNVLPTHEPSAEHIVRSAYAFWQSKTLFAAVELDVFTALTREPLQFETLRARLGLNPRGARDFFDALVALRFLHRTADGQYCNTAESEAYLVRGKATYLGGLLRHLDARHYKNWDLLTRGLVNGEPQTGLGLASYAGFYADQSNQAIFLEGMTGGSLLAARALARLLPWSRYRTIVDIGTAQGCVPVQIAREHPHLSGGGFDLPENEPAFSAYVREHGLEDRLRFFPGDFFAHPLPRADVLIMGRILHNWDDARRQLLLRKAFDAVNAGGALVVYDPMIGDERCIEAHPLLSSLNMLIETAAGSEYSIADCRRWMEAAGFGDVRHQQLCEIHIAVIGRK